MSHDLSSLLQRIEDLEHTARVAKRRRTIAVSVSAVVLAMGAGTALAANGNCPNALPFCFQADTPAIAGQVNQNFAQLKEWMEAKVGPVTSTAATTNALTVNGAETVNGSSSITGTLTAGPFLPSYAAWGTTGAGGAAITNDNGVYKALMVVGNTSAGGARKVKLYDDVAVANSLTVGGVGGNVPFNCVIRSNGGNSGAASSYNVGCAANEIAVGGGARCGSLWRLTESLPWMGASDSDGMPNPGQAARGWRGVCQIWGNAGNYTPPQLGVFAICCAQ